jgi:HEAT repeat protein
MRAAIALLLSVSAVAAPADRILGAREHVITAAEIRSLGEHADRLLIAAAADQKASRWRRARALIALKFAPSEESLAFLRAVVDEKKTASQGADLLDLAAALTSLQPYGNAVLPDLLPFLTHASADVRHAAVVALGAIPEAENALRARLYVEKDPGVARALAKIVSK